MANQTTDQTSAREENRKLAENHAGHLNDFRAGTDYRYELDGAGRKWQRIIRLVLDAEGRPVEHSRSACYFVNLENGNLHEAESWKRPRRWSLGHASTVTVG